MARVPDVLPDTNAFIYFFEGRSRIAEYVLLSDTIFYAIIFEIERLSAVHLTEDDVATIKAFLVRCRRIELTPEVVARTIELRRAERMKTPDAIIAASALSMGVALVTADK
jgi:hypothetical protein